MKQATDSLENRSQRGHNRKWGER